MKLTVKTPEQSVFSNITLATMDPLMDNPFSDIFDNTLDIFSSDYDLDIDLPPPSTDAPSESQLWSQMPLPPEAFYRSATEAEEAIQSWAAQYKYAFVKRRSKRLNSQGRRKDVWYCDCHGNPLALESQRHTGQPCQRHTSSWKTGCECSIFVVEINATSWEVRHRPGSQFQTHNHSQSRSPWSHPTHRKLGKPELDKLAELHSTGKRE